MNRYIDLLINTPPRFYLHTLKYKLAERNEPENYNDIKPCAFVLSTGRAGTETLARLFEIDKNLIAVHEPLPKLFGLSKTCYDLSEHFSSDSKVSAALVEAFLTSRRDLLNYALYTGRGYIETGPHVTFVAPWILQTIPDARFFHMVRDPLAFLLSGINRRWFAGNINDQWRIMPNQGTPFMKIWEDFSQVEKILWLWAETNRWILQFTRTLKNIQHMLIQSEQVFKSDHTVIQQIYALVGRSRPNLEKIERAIETHYNAQKKGSTRLPENWRGKINLELITFVSEVASELGYPVPKIE